MSLTKVRGFFREILDDKDYKEWTDGFNVENIPSTLLEKSYYFIESNEARGVKLNHHDQEIDFSISIYIFKKGHRNPAKAIDEIIEDVEDIIKECLKPTNRVGKFQDGLKNVVLDGFFLEPIDASNDNIVRCRLEFTVRLSIGTN